MSGVGIKVGDGALHVERFFGGTPRFIVRVSVKRETATQWVDEDGTRYWKAWTRKALGMVNRFLMTETEFTAAGGALPVERTQQGAAS